MVAYARNWILRTEHVLQKAWGITSWKMRLDDVERVVEMKNKVHKEALYLTSVCELEEDSLTTGMPLSFKRKVRV